MTQAEYNSLTDRERDCLRLFARSTSKDIAREIGIAPGTVETYIKRARNKLRASNASAAAYALIDYEAGLSRAAATQQPGHDSFVVPDHSGATARVADEVREKRTAFQVAEPSADARAGGYDDKANRAKPGMLKGIATIAIIVAALAVAGVAALPLGDSFQRIANLIDPSP